MAGRDTSVLSALGVPVPRAARSVNTDQREFRLTKLPTDLNSLEKMKTHLTAQMTKVAELLLHPDAQVSLRASRSLNGTIREVIDVNSKLRQLKRGNTDYFSPAQVILKGFEVLKPDAPHSELFGSTAIAQSPRIRELFQTAVTQALNVLRPEAKREFLAGLESKEWLPPSCKEVFVDLKERHWFSAKAQEARAALGL